MDLPEVFLSNTLDKDKIYYLQQQAKIRRIAPRLYTSNMQDSLDAIVRRNLWTIVALFYPKAIISERTAMEMKVAPDGYDTALSTLQRTNAFIDPNEADESGIRLVLP